MFWVQFERLAASLPQPGPLGYLDSGSHLHNTCYSIWSLKGRLTHPLSLALWAVRTLAPTCITHVTVSKRQVASHPQPGLLGCPDSGSRLHNTCYIIWSLKGRLTHPLSLAL
jgi:hypothetical protein